MKFQSFPDEDDDLEDLIEDQLDSRQLQAIKDLEGLPMLLEEKFEFVDNVYWKIPIKVPSDLEEL